ncbi:MAG TPA: peptide deformylase [Myxococcales bacterium]|jgi:peptide deformylase
MHASRLLPLAALLLLASCAHGGLRPLAEKERPTSVVTFKPGEPVPAALRAKAEPVDPRDPQLRQLIDAMMVEFERTGGVGLAAPQVGVSRRLVLIKLGTRPKGDVRVEAFVNPIIEDVSQDSELDWEACLSVDGGGGQVRRFKRIILTYDPVGGGSRIRARLADWDARIAQHEVDHLDGVLFTDKVAGRLVPMAEMRKRRDELHRKRGWLPPEAAAPAPAEPPAAPSAPPPADD